VLGSGKAQEHDLGVGGFGDFEEYNGAIEYDDNEQLYKTTYTHQEYAKGIAVERKLVDDDLYNIINQRPRQLGLAAARTREQAKKLWETARIMFESSPAIKKRVKFKDSENKVLNPANHGKFVQQCRLCSHGL
jgi:hypothetical protein